MPRSCWWTVATVHQPCTLEPCTLEARMRSEQTPHWTACPDQRRRVEAHADLLAASRERIRSREGPSSVVGALQQRASWIQESLGHNEIPRSKRASGPAASLRPSGVMKVTESAVIHAARVTKSVVTGSPWQFPPRAQPRRSASRTRTTRTRPKTLPPCPASVPMHASEAARKRLGSDLKGLGSDSEVTRKRIAAPPPPSHRCCFLCSDS